MFSQCRRSLRFGTNKTPWWWHSSIQIHLRLLLCLFFFCAKKSNCVTLNQRHCMDLHRALSSAWNLMDPVSRVSLDISQAGEEWVCAGNHGSCIHNAHDMFETLNTTIMIPCAHLTEGMGYWAHKERCLFWWLQTATAIYLPKVPFCWLFRYLYTGKAFEPLTFIFENISNWTPNPSANRLITGSGSGSLDENNRKITFTCKLYVRYFKLLWSDSEHSKSSKILRYLTGQKTCT